MVEAISGSNVRHVDIDIERIDIERIGLDGATKPTDPTPR
jgi:hypothetical protein